MSLDYSRFLTLLLSVFVETYFALYPSIIVAQEQVQTKPAVELYMSFAGRGSSQGAACFDRYLFVGNQYNKVMDVYDLEEKRLVCHITMPECNSRCHANTLNFGTQYFQQGDEFPLLYVSSSCVTNSTEDISDVYVYRIQKKKEGNKIVGFKITQVQLIELQGYSTWRDCICDNEHEAIWVGFSSDEKRCYFKYEVPSIIHERVRISRKTTPALDSIFVDRISAIKTEQGDFCQDGFIYFPAGHSRQIPFWVAVSLETHDYEYIVNLFDLEGIKAHAHSSLDWEPEFLFSYKGEHFIGFRKFIYKMDLTQVKQANYFYNRYKMLH